MGWCPALLRNSAAPTRPLWRLGVLGGVIVLCAGCATVKRAAVDEVGDALAGNGATFAADNDPELIRAAAPFSLKLIESLLAENPRHPGLLLAASRGFIEYAYAFVQQDADELEDKDFAGAIALRERARKLYLRGRNYGLRLLDLGHPGMAQGLRLDPRAAVAAARREDVPAMYWTALAWMAVISLSKDKPEIVGDLPAAEALIDRSLELDEAFEHGAIHVFLITYEMSRPVGIGDPAARSRGHFARAVELSGGRLASPYDALAEAVCVQKQDAAGFRRLLAQALAVDPEGAPEWRLENAVMQRRAQWLLGRMDQLFAPDGREGKK